MLKMCIRRTRITAVLYLFIDRLAGYLGGYIVGAIVGRGGEVVSAARLSLCPVFPGWDFVLEFSFTEPARKAECFCYSLGEASVPCYVEKGFKVG
jgi:hypothetical protein